MEHELSRCANCDAGVQPMAPACNRCGKPIAVISGPNVATKPSMKACPYCAEEILEAAIKCKHCGSDIGSTGVGSARGTMISGDSYIAQALKVASPYPGAPLSSRVVAYIYDIFWQILLTLPGAVVLLIGISTDVQVLSVLGGTGLAAGFVWAIVYAFTKDGGGASRGKRAMKLMVVHLPTNMPCTTSQSALRTGVLMGLNLIPFVGWLIEPIVMLAADRGRRLGDRIAETQVIESRYYTENSDRHSAFAE